MFLKLTSLLMLSSYFIVSSALKSKIERKYCLISTSCLTAFFAFPFVSYLAELGVFWRTFINADTL